MAIRWTGKTWSPSAQIIILGYTNLVYHAGTGKMWTTGYYNSTGNLAFIGFDVNTFALTEWNTGIVIGTIVYNFASDGTYFYFADGVHVYKFDPSAGTTSTLATPAAGCQPGVIFDGTYLWVLSMTSAGNTDHAYRITLGGSITSYVIGTTGHSPGYDTFTQLVTDGTYLYALSGSAGMFTIKLSAPTSLTFYSAGNYNQNFSGAWHDSATGWWGLGNANSTALNWPVGAASITAYTGLVYTNQAQATCVDATGNLWITSYRGTANGTTIASTWSSPTSAPATQTSDFQASINGSTVTLYGGDVMGLDNSSVAWLVKAYNSGSGAYVVAKNVAPVSTGQLVMPL